jgi:hypothetical protein
MASVALGYLVDSLISGRLMLLQGTDHPYLQEAILIVNRTGAEQILGGTYGGCIRAAAC